MSGLVLATEGSASWDFILIRFIAPPASVLSVLHSVRCGRCGGFEWGRLKNMLLRWYWKTITGFQVRFEIESTRLTGY